MSWWVYDIIREYEQKNGVNLTDLRQALKEYLQQPQPGHHKVFDPVDIVRVEPGEDIWIVTLRDGRRQECSTVLCADSAFLVV